MEGWPPWLRSPVIISGSRLRIRGVLRFLFTASRAGDAGSATVTRSRRYRVRWAFVADGVAPEAWLRLFSSCLRSRRSSSELNLLKLSPLYWRPSQGERIWRMPYKGPPVHHMERVCRVNSLISVLTTTTTAWKNLSVIREFAVGTSPDYCTDNFLHGSYLFNLWFE